MTCDKNQILNSQNRDSRADLPGYRFDPGLAGHEENLSAGLLAMPGQVVQGSACPAIVVLDQGIIEQQGQWL